MDSETAQSLAQRLIISLQEVGPRQVTSEHEARIEVSQSVSSVALAYERMRNALGYQQEQMLRRVAIERFIKRRLTIGQTIDKIAPLLVRELILSGYLENNQVPERRIKEVGVVLDKYAAMAGYLDAEARTAGLGIIAAEIENCLVSHAHDEVILRYFYQFIVDQLALQDPLSKGLVLTALYEGFLKADTATVSYYLLRFYWPEWDTLAAEHLPQYMEHYQKVMHSVELLLHHPQKNRYHVLAKRYYPLFFVLRTIVASHPTTYADILGDSALFEQQVNAVMSAYHLETQDKLHRSIWKALIFILITKVTVGLLFELPYDLYFYGELHWAPLGINLLVPPTLMFLSTFIVQVPGPENTRKLSSLLEAWLYQSGGPAFNDLVKSSTLPRTQATTILLNAWYATTFLLIFGLVAWTLYRLQFSPISGALFFIFLSTVSFLAFRIRTSASELQVVRKEDHGFVLLLDFFQLPFLKVGYWLSGRLKTANVFLFIFDFILEAPFKTLLEMSEQWLGFLREKKEEIS